MSVESPVCAKCDKTSSIYWSRTDDGSVICNDCFEGGPSFVGGEDSIIFTIKQEDNGSKVTTRRSTRTNGSGSTKGRASYTVPKKGKGRRAIFKKVCMKAPSAVATVVTSESIIYKGEKFSVGDIVSVCGTDDKTYYCQLRGFLTDQYCQKSGVITWLYPSDRSPPPDEGFDPATYIIGVDEDIPRTMECFTFVMAAPSEYYKSNKTPYPPVSFDVLPSTRTSYSE